MASPPFQSAKLDTKKTLDRFRSLERDPNERMTAMRIRTVLASHRAMVGKDVPGISPQVGFNSRKETKIVDNES